MTIKLYRGVAKGGHGGMDIPPPSWIEKKIWLLNYSQMTALQLLSDARRC